ncbi:porin family protein [Bacteroides sp. 224]|uniref:porin family protein n=1 Tax=Bacteroides sp. 224 TaxID=2302936 RepID=UPI0013CF841F|nr:porin family protein [Bacteroides sp. 224]NDV63812.1 porin family protein [Bacteroides sp. 224]
MKKFVSVLIIALSLGMVMPAQAQIKFGVKGGLNMSELDIKNGPTSDNTTGFYIGPMAEVTIPIVGLGLDGALMYSQRGKDEWKQQGIEIPVNLKYTFGLGSMLGVYVAAGPDFFFNFKDIKFATDDNKLVDTEKTQVGLNLGAGVKLIKHLQVGVNYQIPLGDSFSWDTVIDAAGNEIKGGNGKTKTWQVSVAYIF